VVQFLLSTCFENADCTLQSKQLQRGYHVCSYVAKDNWDSEIVFCERENQSENRNPSSNLRDPQAVALRKDGIIVQWPHSPCDIVHLHVVFIKCGDSLLCKPGLSF